MMKRIQTLIACIAVVLVFTSRAKPAEENVDKPKESKTGVAAQGGKVEVKGTGFRGSYFVNGEIHVNEYGTP